MDHIVCSEDCVVGLTGIQPVPREFCDKRRYKVRLLSETEKLFGDDPPSFLLHRRA